MVILKKLLLLGGLTVGVLAIFTYINIARSLIHNYYHLKELNFTEEIAEAGAS